ncbi:MAG: flagellar assembly protein FliX [Sphingobacteriia bacterium]|nr:flagellar assembly protein FliX [Sphingobacteriia bacterium]
MRIESNKPVTSVSGVNKGSKNKGGTGFSDALSKAQAEKLSSQQNIQATQSIFIIPDIADELTKEKKKRVISNARDVLKELNSLKTALLNGRLSEENLINIENQLLKLKEENSDDPKLIQIINDIEIRAAVELTKFGK